MLDLQDDIHFKMYSLDFPIDASKTVIWTALGGYEFMAETYDGEKLIYDHLDRSIRYYVPEQMEFAYRLRRKLLLNHLRQEDLAEMTDLSRLSINNYVTGKSVPSYYNARKIARALNCSLDDFVYER